MDEIRRFIQYTTDFVNDVLVGQQGDVVTLSFTMDDGTTLDIELDSNMKEYIKESLKAL